ncbi:hypothetical protein D3C75_549390 [compost metagenome]
MHHIRGSHKVEFGVLLGHQRQIFPETRAGIAQGCAGLVAGKFGIDGFGVIRCYFGIQNAVLVPFHHGFGIFLKPRVDRTINHLAVLDKMVLVDAPCSGEIGVLDIADASRQRSRCPLLFLEGLQNGIHLVDGFGYLQTKVIQPILAHKAAKEGIDALVTLEERETELSALLGLHIHQQIGIGLINFGQVRRILGDFILDVHQNAILEGLLSASRIISEGSHNKVRNVPGCQHEVKLLLRRTFCRMNIFNRHIQPFLQLFIEFGLGVVLHNRQSRAHQRIPDAEFNRFFKRDLNGGVG